MEQISFGFFEEFEVGDSVKVVSKSIGNDGRKGAD